MDVYLPPQEREPGRRIACQTKRIERPRRPASAQQPARPGRERTSATMRAATRRQPVQKKAPAARRTRAVDAQPPSVSGQFSSVPILSRCACGGNCPRCRKKSHQPTGLRITEPHDIFEREADAVADHVMNMASIDRGLQRIGPHYQKGGQTSKVRPCNPGSADR